MPSDPLSAAPRGGLPSVDRLLALSDGVVAIAITLLVLQLNVPKLADPNSASELAVKLGNGPGHPGDGTLSTWQAVIGIAGEDTTGR